MKKAAHLILINTSILIIMYLTGSFVAADFNIKTWVSEGRFFTAFVALALMAFLSAVYIDETKKH